MKSQPAPLTKPFSARLSLPAHALIYQRAREAGVSSREWLERAILANRTRIVTRKKVHPDLGALLFQVNRAGNNLNQLAHHFNGLVLQRDLHEEDMANAVEALVAVETLLTEALHRAD